MTTVNFLAERAMLTGAAGDLTTAVTGTLLGTNVITLVTDADGYTPGKALGDYTVADYDGYADEAITWSAATLADDGSIELIGTVGEFRPTGSTVENTITAVLHCSAGGAVLHGASVGGEGLPMNSALDSVIVVPRVRINLDGLLEIVS